MRRLLVVAIVFVSLAVVVVEGAVTYEYVAVPLARSEQCDAARAAADAAYEAADAAAARGAAADAADEAADAAYEAADAAAARGAAYEEARAEEEEACVTLSERLLPQSIEDLLDTPLSSGSTSSSSRSNVVPYTTNDGLGESGIDGLGRPDIDGLGESGGNLGSGNLNLGSGNLSDGNL